MKLAKNLPPGWVSTTIGELLLNPKANIVDGPFGSNLKASEYQPQGVPVLRLQNIKRLKFIHKNIQYISHKKAKELARHSYRSGDIVITKLGAPLGEACILPPVIEDGVIVADLVRLRLDNQHVDKKWLCYAINADGISDQLKVVTKGTTRPRVNLTHIRELQIDIPPLNEQRRIVAKIEELFSELDKGVESLTTARDQLRAYRQSVLKHAFEGKLINAPRGRNAPWPERQLGGLIQFLTSGSRGWADHYADHGDLFIRAQNLKRDRLDLSDAAFVILPQGRTEGVRTRVQLGDVLITITGANVTKAGLVDRELGTAYVSQHVALCRPTKNLMPEFLYWYLLSEAGGRRQLNEAAYGAGKPGLNLDNIRNLFIPVPSLAEQRAVVSLIVTALNSEEHLRGDVSGAQDRIEALRQSILKRAFSGQLVPQDAADELASVLLERIRAAREDRHAKKQRNNEDGKKQAA